MIDYRQHARTNHLPDKSPQIDSHIRVITPENIGFEYRMASPFERLMAFAIDSAIMGLAIAVVSITAILLLGIVGAGGIGWGLALVTWFVVTWFYGGVFETFWNGQTPGKRSLGLRVLSTDGSPINAGQAVLRNFLRFVDSQPLYTYLVGLVSTAMNRRYQRLGDLACGTMVVAEDRTRAARLNDLNDVLLSPVENLLPPGAVPSRTLAKAISLYVDRRRYFGPARRAEIARHVGEMLVQQYRLPPGIDHDALLCALYRRAFLSQPADEFLALDSATEPASRPKPLQEFELPA